MKKYINTTQALDIIKKSWLADCYKPNLPSLIMWIKKFDLGYKFAGRWQVDKKELEKFIKGDILDNGNEKKTKKR